MIDSYKCLDDLDNKHKFYNLSKLAGKHSSINSMPYSIKILLENLLRTEDGVSVTKDDIDALLNYSPKTKSSHEIAFTPSRVILQDFTGVPAVVDLAAMRNAMVTLGGTPEKINPLSPVELVIDHSVMVDDFGHKNSLTKNIEMEFKRNLERYSFLKWGQTALNNFKVVPPGTGIVHQVNLEYLARVVFTKKIDDQNIAYPDTLVGTDSHTTMINGIGVLGWGVGGIEAEAAMLGQPITMLIPEVIGFKLTGKLKEGTTATDLVLTVVQMLREKGVVGKFVEFFGEGLDYLPVADRATIANMAPEYGATCGIFPIDDATLNFMNISGRDQSEIDLVEKYAKAQGMFRDNTTKINFTDTLELDLSSVEPSIAGPKRPQDRIPLANAKNKYKELISEQIKNRTAKPNDLDLKDGDVVIAAITSCTNTSNPDVMIAAGLLAKKANALGLKSKPWVKTSLAPGSQVVTDYLNKAELMTHLEDLGFNLVGYGCTTCIGNSGPLPKEISDAIVASKLMVSSVLSGNRNFEGRIHPLVKNSYLASPPLVVAYALAGTLDFDFYNDPLGQSKDGKEIFLKDIWPSRDEIIDCVNRSIKADMFTTRYKTVFDGDEQWKKIDAPTGELYNWDKDSTYVKNPPFFTNMTKEAPPVTNITGARVLVKLGDSVTTDHISPAGSIAVDSPAGKYLQELGVDPLSFNSYGSRRGNHEVMMRGTFANIRLQNQLSPGTEGSWTVYFTNGESMSIYDASMRYQENKIPLVILAGSEYGTGSSRDWAAKGTRLLGVNAVIAKSYERIHRSNLIGMGVLPLQFKDGESADTLKLDGTEKFDIDLSSLKPQNKLKVKASKANYSKEFEVLVRIDTPKELEYYQHGGILHYVLRQLAGEK